MTTKKARVSRPVDGLVVPSDEDIKDQMEDAGWICNRRGWWHPPSCLAAWPFDEAKAMFLKRHNEKLTGGNDRQKETHE